MPARLLHLRPIICDEFSELKLKDEDACRVLPEHPEERTKEIVHWHGAGQGQILRRRRPVFGFGTIA
jgi:hypothetical protein